MHDSQPYLYAYLYFQVRTEQFRQETERDAKAKSFENSKGNVSGKFFGQSLLKLKRRLALVARTA